MLFLVILLPWGIFLINFVSAGFFGHFGALGGLFLIDLVRKGAKTKPRGAKSDPKGGQSEPTGDQSA